MAHARVAAGLRQHVVATLARGHVAGPSVADALRIGARVAAEGHHLTLGPWVAKDAEPAAVAGLYGDTIRGIASCRLPATVSIKLPDLAFDRRLIHDVVDCAQQAGVGLHLDSHRPDAAGPTLDLLEQLLELAPGTGCTLPGRWARSVEDAARVRQLGVQSVRVVKGEWEDPDDPGRDPAAGTLEVIDALSGVGALVGLASHDADLVSAAAARCTASGTAWRVEQLYGLPPVGTMAAEHLGANPRHHPLPRLVYLPFGTAYLPYALSKVLRQPHMLRWIVRDLVGPKRLG